MSQHKQTVVSFRVDQHLAEILNNLPDKSGFIRDAILKRFHSACPCCQGRGVLPEVIAEWLMSKLPDYESAECSCCHFRYPVEVVKSQFQQQPSDTFLCPHCADHEHTH